MAASLSTSSATPVYRRFADRAMACQAAGGPVYFSPPAFTLFGNKAMLPYLADAPAGLLLTTRRLDAATRTSALGNRADQVLKPAIGYGGEGVVIGAHCTPQAWQAALDGALDSRQPHVLQDYVAPAAIRMPSPEGDTPYHVGIGCLAFGRRLGGFLLRQTPGSGTRHRQLQAGRDLRRRRHRRRCLVRRGDRTTLG
jgi:hypothetical protein